MILDKGSRITYGHLRKPIPKKHVASDMFAQNTPPHPEPTYATMHLESDVYILRPLFRIHVEHGVWLDHKTHYFVPTSSAF